MLVLAISLAMVTALATATAVALHSDNQSARVKVVARKTRIMN